MKTYMYIYVYTHLGLQSAKGIINTYENIYVYICIYPPGTFFSDKNPSAVGTTIESANGIINQ